jgi:multiple sugar transport system substrate-binding protein
MKRSNIRKFPLLVSASLVFSILFTACSTQSAANSSSSSGTDDKTPVTINVTHWESNTGDKAAWEAATKKFESENPNITVNSQVVPSGDKYYTALDTRIAGNDAPDVAKLTYQKMGKYISGGVLLDITKSIDSETKADLIPAFKAAMTYNNKLYGIPHMSDTMVIFYNKAMMEKAGVTDIPTSVSKAWTWQQFTDVAKKVKAANNLQYAFAYNWTKNCAYRALPLLYMNGGAVLDSTGKKAAVDNAKGVEWLNYIQSWVKDGLITKSSPNATDSPYDLFCNGVVGMCVAGTYNLPYFDTNMKTSYGATFMPQVNGKTGSDMGGSALVAFSKSKHPAAAEKFLKFMIRSDNLKAYDEVYGDLPVRTSLTKTTLTYASHQDMMKLFTAQGATIDPKMASVEANPKFDVIESAMANNIEKIILKGESGSQAAKDMASDINSALSES